MERSETSFPNHTLTFLEALKQPIYIERRDSFLARFISTLKLDDHETRAATGGMAKSKLNEASVCSRDNVATQQPSP